MPRATMTSHAFALPLLPLCLLLLGACSSQPEPDPPLPSQTIASATPRLEPPPPLPPPIRELPPTPQRSEVMVIEAGGTAEKPTTLVEASRRAKAQKREAPPGQPVATITDENLHEYSERAEIMVLESDPAAPSPMDVAAAQAAEDAAADLASDTDSGDQVRDEDYWRNRALELRMGWRRSFDQIQELELESAALRQQFYAEEDPYIRDSQLKPAWDRVLDRLDRLRDRASRYELELDIFIEEGHQAGVRQGWLNQGWELEPTSEERQTVIGRRPENPESHQATDIQVLEDDEVDP